MPEEPNAADLPTPVRGKQQPVRILSRHCCTTLKGARIRRPVLGSILAASCAH